MNCPYCNAGVHAMAKYCPKCGLPLKDDATVMASGGAYVTDDTGGPAMWAVLGGAGLLMALVVAIGFIGNRKSEPERRAQTPPTNPAFNPASNFGMRPINPALPVNPAGAAPRVDASRSADYNPQVRWAYRPPAVLPAPQPLAVPQPERVEAPPVNLVEQTAREALASRPTVTVARASTPEIPPFEPTPGYATLGPGESLPQPTAGPPPTPQLTPEQAEIRRLEQEGVITYDPVQERYVIIPGRRPRRAAPSGSQANPGAVRPLPQPADVGNQFQPAGLRSGG